MDHHNNHLTIRTFMAITAERDTAIRERNMALEERKRAFAERDMAMLQRDAAIAERNAAMQERDVALTASLGFRETSMDPNDDDSTGNEQLTTKHIILYQQQQQQQQHQQQQQQQMHVVPEEAAVAYNYSNLNNPREAKAPSLVLVKRESRSSRDDSRDYDDDYASGTANKPPPKKGERQQQPKEGKQTKSTKLPSRLLAGKKRKANSSSTSNNSWKNIESDDEEEDDVRKQQQALVSWKDNNLGLNQISFDESSMPGPVCTCTGSPQPCYRWGSGGWQSACCTTTISMYPLPQVANKRYSRVGGRKMSGSAFTKLLNRLAAKGYDLSTPLDLKDNWAKHGTNRYSTLK